MLSNKIRVMHGKLDRYRNDLDVKLATANILISQFRALVSLADYSCYYPDTNEDPDTIRVVRHMYGQILEKVIQDIDERQLRLGTLGERFALFRHRSRNAETNDEEIAAECCTLENDLTYEMSLGSMCTTSVDILEMAFSRL